VTETTTAGDRSFLVGLIGAGIGPSLTPAMHEREASALGRRLVYRTIDIDVLNLPPEAVGDLVRSAPRYGFDGLNITHPCKQLVLPHLDRLAPDAAALGAVNTVVFDNGAAVGHNTDWSGFLGALEDGLPGAGRDRVVLSAALGPVSVVLVLGREHRGVHEVDELGTQLRELVAESLRRGNSLGMFGGYLQAGEGQNYGGPRFLSDWYARNFNMAHNLTRLLRPDVRRVLVIVGAGHVAPLRNLLDEAPQFCPVSPLSLLR
jgi:hypothetical protein